MTGILIAPFLILLPVCEFLGLRYLLHSVLGIRIGWGSLMVDADLFVPGIVTFFLYFICTVRRDHPRLCLQARFGIANAFLFTIFVGINLVYFPLFRMLGLNFQIIWWAAALGTLATAFFVWVPPAFYFRQRRWVFLAPLLLMTLSIVICKHFFNEIWLHVIEGMKVNFCPKIQAVLGEPVYCRVLTSPEGDKVLRMSVSSLKAFVGKPCSGIDGLIFFASLSFLVLLKFREELSLFRWALASFGGLFLMFILNPLRIAFLFVAAVKFSNLFSSRGLSFFESVIHTNVGWILYLFFGVCYFRSLLPILKSSPKTEYRLSSLLHVLERTPGGKFNL